MSDSVVSDHNAPSFQALYPGSFQAVAFTGSAAQSKVFDPTTTLVKLFATQDCWIIFGVNPTAVVGTPGNKGTSVRLRGGIVEYFGVPKNQSYVVSVVQDSQSGTLDITEGA